MAGVAADPRHIVAVMGVVRDGRGRVLLVRTPRRGWEPPGGQVERGEDLIAALEREILEESGCTVAAGRLVGVYSNTGPLGLVNFVFLCAHIVGEPCGGAECPEAGWFAPEEAFGLVTHPAQSAKLRDALAADQRPGVVYRAFHPVTAPNASAGHGDPTYAWSREQRC